MSKTQKVKYLTVEVTKDKMSKVRSRVPQWEAQVILALWADEAHIVGESFEIRTLPEVNGEFTRLANKYGPRDEEVPIVAKVYGSFGPGLKSLEHEFGASILAEEAPRGNGDGIVPGVELPGSDETFGPDAVPEVTDDFADLTGAVIS